MKIKRFRHRSVMEQEVRFAEGWLKVAEQNLAMAEDNLREVRAMAQEEKNPSRDLLLLLRDSVRLVKDAEDWVTFFDGVLVGMLQMKKALEEHAAEDIENPFELYRK